MRDEITITTVQPYLSPVDKHVPHIILPLMEEEKEELGIENLKEVLTSAIDTVALSIGALKDGVQLSDIKVVPRLGIEVYDVMTHLNKAVAEVKDLSGEEAKELIEVVISRITELLTA